MGLGYSELSNNRSSDSPALPEPDLPIRRQARSTQLHCKFWRIVLALPPHKGHDGGGVDQRTAVFPTAGKWPSTHIFNIRMQCGLQALRLRYLVKSTIAPKLKEVQPSSSDVDSFVSRRDEAQTSPIWNHGTCQRQNCEHPQLSAKPNR